MKKVLSIVLAIAMIAAMSVDAFAAAGSETLTATGDVEIAVNGVYVADDEAKIDNYKVIVAWDDFTFTFTSGETWNVEDHAWDLTEGAGEWTIVDKNITVTNHSSLAVTATAAYNGDGAFTFTNNDAEVAACAEGGDAPAETIVATFVPGDLTIDKDGALGTITVTIA